MQNVMLKRIVGLANLNSDLLVEIEQLRKSQLQSEIRNEESMRVIIKMLGVRGDMLRNEKERADNWMGISQRMRIRR